MKIQITYDASVADAPAGYKAAVQAAVKYFEQAFSTPTTVNITFSWGEVAGQTIAPTSLAASATTTVSPIIYGEGDYARLLVDRGVASPAIEQAGETILRSGNFGFGAPPPTATTYSLPLAEARALGQITGFNTTQDGYVGLGSSASYTFDPANRAVAGKYDAIGIIESEISKVLGRELLEGNPPPEGGSPTYAPLDFLRYSSAGVHTETPGGGYFSLNGDQLLLPFNNPANGGDPAGWSQKVPGDAFDAFDKPGTELSISAIDLREMEVLGYSLSYTASTPNGTPVTPQTVDSDFQLLKGQSATFNGPRAILLGPSGKVENAGSIVDTGTRSLTDVVGVSSAYAVKPVFTNAVSGLLSVTATAQAADAVGIYSYDGLGTGVVHVTNAGTIKVVSQYADAWGSIDGIFTNTATGVLKVSAADHATGVIADGTFSNAGTIDVTGLHAIGVELDDQVGFTNTGTIKATSVGAGGTSIAVFLGAPLTDQTVSNSGDIEGRYAFQGSSHVKIINSGTISGQIALSGANDEIDNTGSIAGAIQFGDGNSIYSGAKGTQAGGIYLGHGNNTVMLGDDGEAVVSGGGADTITGGRGNDFIVLASGNNTVDGGGGVLNTLSFADAALPVIVNLATGSATAGGTDTISNIQRVIGSNYGSALTAGDAGAVLIAGQQGHSVLQGGAGNDTLVAGAGGTTMSGGAGNNTFIYSTGDRSVTLTDFNTSGAHDALQIYGYDAASSIVQKGADTLITLAQGDIILLKNVTAGSLSEDQLVFHTAPYVPPSISVKPPIYGTTTIYFTYDLTIFANETINEANQSLGFVGNYDNKLDNAGHIAVSSASGDTTGVSSGSSITNEAGASFSVIDTDATGIATGLSDPSSSVSNAGLFSVSAKADAYGIWTYTGPVITNASTGVMNVSSTAGTATGFYLYNGDDFFGKGVTNEGSLHVTGAVGAYGIASDNGSATAVINDGSIVVDGASQTYGLDIAGNSVVTNTGNLTATTAIVAQSGNLKEGDFSLTNSGTINGDIDVVNNSAKIVNTGSINGAIHAGDGDVSYMGASGTLTGAITLGYGKNVVTLGDRDGAVLGGGYSDHITGGAGNDFFEIGRGNNVIDGGGGSNTLSLADADLGYTVDLQNGVATGAGSDQIKNIQTVIGSSFNDTLSAAASGSTLIAGSGFDVLKGAAGNDKLVAGAGGDTMSGGGGNNTFIYSKGDHTLTITDFDQNGDSDTLHIDGFASAASIKQAGADTVIALSDGGQIDLKGVQQASLGAGAIVFSSSPYHAPVAPVSRPIFFSDQAPIYIDYANDVPLAIFKGETVRIVSHTSMLDTNANVALEDFRDGLGQLTLPVLSNHGTLSITSADDGLIGIAEFGNSHTVNLTNESGATLSVSDSSGSALGIRDTVTFSHDVVTNAGKMSVSAMTSATGIAFGGVDNDKTGTLTVASKTADAVGIDASALIENDGAIVVTGVTQAIGLRDLQGLLSGFNEGVITNNGTITASAGPSGQSIGIEVSYSYNVSVISHIDNHGTITAQTAIMNADSGDGYNPIAMTNSGTINGAVDMGGGESQLTNTGTVNGDITFLTITKEMNDGSLFGIFPPALTNSGTVKGDIFLNGSKATITNTGHILSSDIELGTDGTFVTTQGTVVIGSHLTAVTGTIVVGDDGTLQGAGAIHGNVSVAADGTVATTGALVVTGNISGSGHVSIDHLASLEISGSLSAGAAFMDGSGLLKLDTAASQSGTIDGLQAGDVIDLAAIHAAKAVIDTKNGLLTVTDTDAHTFTFHIAGDLAGNQFSISNDGKSGSDLLFGSPSKTGSDGPVGFHGSGFVAAVEDLFFSHWFHSHIGDML